MPPGAVSRAYRSHFTHRVGGVVKFCPVKGGSDGSKECSLKSLQFVGILKGL